MISMLLALAILTGQWLASTHDRDHGLGGAAHSCAVCVYAHAAGSGALPAAPILDLSFGGLAHEFALVLCRVPAFDRHQPIRGPPQLL